MSSKFSSMDIWTAKPASGFTLGSDNRSVERTKKFPWNVWMDRPVWRWGGMEGGFKLLRKKVSQRRTKTILSKMQNRFLVWLCHLTFGAAYPHDRLKADLPCQVPLQILLEALYLRWVMLVVVGGIVVDASCRVSWYAACKKRILSNYTLPHWHVICEKQPLI